MKKKNLLVILLTAIIFIAGAVLGVTAVFRVNEILVVAPVVSETAKTEAEDLKNKLLKAYDKKSIFSADASVAKNVVLEFPYFHITKFEKAYPNRLIVTVKEGEEVYAVRQTDSEDYYILDEKGTVLEIRESTKNRVDGAENVLIIGEPALSLSGEKGKTIVGDSCLDTLFSFCKEVSTKLNGIRINVASVAVLRPASSETETLFKLSMREGVTLYVRNPAKDTVLKAQTAVDKYLSLSDSEKLKGAILVFDGTNGLQSNYYEKDDIGI